MLNRRDILLGAPAIVGVAATPFAEWRSAQAQTVVQRQSAANAAEQLAVYSNGVAAMRQLTSEDKRKWEHFGGIHGNSCQHAHWWFLPWHRIYILQFEQIIRNLTSVTTFALPYWNQYAQRVTPQQFTSPATTSNPLYTSQRASCANNGCALNLSTVDPRLALAATTFADFTGPAVSAPSVRGPKYGKLENVPHNTIHNAVGGSTGWMSSLSNAPLDPLFWLHHCNLDRLWEVWLQQGGGRANPTSTAWLNQTFTFPNETGASVTTRVGDVLNIGALGYTYDDLAVPGSTMTTAAAPLLAAAETSNGAPMRNVSAKAQVENVLLDGSKITILRLPSAIGTIVVEGITGNPRGSNFAVYANLPKSVQPNTEASSPYFIGSIAPFGFGEMHRHGNTVFEFEILPRLVVGKSELVLTFVPNTKFGTRSITVAHIRLVPK